jgi:hypothetical protein
MPIILTFRSGQQVIIKGEDWAKVSGRTQLGVIYGESMTGHLLHIRRDEVAVAEDFPDREWRDHVELQRKKLEAVQAAQARRPGLAAWLKRLVGHEKPKAS